MKYIKAIALLALACGAPIDEDFDFETPEELGTAQQPIFMPLNYGMEGDTTRCSPPWSGSSCQVPDLKTISYKISNCGSGTDFTAVRNAVSWAGVIGNQVGFNLTYNPSFANWNINCTGDQSGAPGSTVADTSTMDCHSTVNGNLCQFQGGVITIRRGVLLNACSSFGCTTAQYDRILQNVARHEIGHTIGLGHVPYSPTKLMSVQFASPPDGTTNPWNNLLGLQNEEKDMLKCYRETSGTTPGPLCPP